MADGDVIAGEQEAAQDSLADAVHPEAEQSDLPGDAVDDGAADAGLTLTTDDIPDLDTLWSRYPSLREQYETEQATKLQEREIAGANRERARLQREAGATENTRRNVARFLNDVGIDPTEMVMLPDGRTQMARAEYLYSLAAANAAHDLAERVPETLLRSHVIPVEVREQAVEARERGDWDAYVSTLLNGAVDAKDAERQKTFDAKVTTEVNKRLAAEIKARELEKAPRRDAMPPPPRGVASDRRITGQQWADASRDQRRQWENDGYTLVSGTGAEVVLGR